MRPPTRAGAPRLGHRRRRDREVPARVGVREVHRRAHRRSLVAPRPLPRLRRRHRVLGAGRDGPVARRHRSRTSAGRGRRRSFEPAIELHVARSRGARLDRAPARPSARPRRARRAGPARISSRPGGSSSSGLAEQGPAVLLFEDLHWADAALLDFVEYLLEWSRNYPLFVLTLARPELLERRPTWGAGRRNFHSLVPRAASRGRARRAPARPRARASRRAARSIRERAEGVPLYAVETVRMLLDRGLLVRENGGYGLTGPVEALEVPETLHALIAARLDGLGSDGAPAPRGRFRARQDVHGPGAFRRLRVARGDLDTCSRRSSAGRSSPSRPIPVARARPVRLPARARPEGRIRHAGPEGTQGAPPRRRRLPRGPWGADDAEIVEVVAAHYLEAYRAAPDAADATAIKAGAAERLARAAERAASLAANEEAQRYFEQAADLADSPRGEAELRERAGEAGSAAGDVRRVPRAIRGAIALFEASATRIRPRGSRRGWRQISRAGPQRRGDRADGARLSRPLDGRAGRRPRAACPRARPASTLRGRDAPCERTGRARPRDCRVAQILPRSSRRRSTRRHSCSATGRTRAARCFGRPCESPWSTI